MLQQLVMALGAGLASALLFVLPAKGSILAMVIGVVAPLPLMIAALGFGPRAGFLGVCTGTVTIALVLHPILAVVFLLSVAGPALLLSWIAVRSPEKPGIPLAWIVVVTTLLGWAGIAVLGWRYPSYEAAVSDLAARLAPMFLTVFGSAEAIPGGLSANEFATYVVTGMAPIMAAWGVLGLALNLWLAARVVQISGLLMLPWPGLPARLRLPRGLFWGFGLALAACLLPGVYRIFAATAATAALTGFALHGLALVHAVTRGQGARTVILAAIYAVTVALFPWPLLIAAGLGLADAARPFRRGAGSAPSSKQ
jgi:hypothetical protein